MPDLDLGAWFAENSCWDLITVHAGAQEPDIDLITVHAGDLDLITVHAGDLDLITVHAEDEERPHD
jgi:hypothetical protein